MPSWLWVILLVISIGAITSVVSSYLNRHVRSVETAARIHVRKRLLSREPITLNNFLAQSSIPNEFQPGAVLLLSRFAAVLGVAVEFLQPAETLRDLLRVTQQDLAFDALEWEKTGLSDHIDVFIYDIFEALQSTCDAIKWKQRRLDLPHPPQSEEEWIEFLLPLQLRELLQFFAPLVTTHR